MFLFQAEDGIRDLVRSRGLGDVYKRQVPDLATIRDRAQNKWRKRIYGVASLGWRGTARNLSLIHI